MTNNSIGVWMDSQNAKIIRTAENGDAKHFEVVSEIACDDHEGADYKNERVEQSRDNQEQKKYFKAIAAELESASKIYVFGPGKAQEQFKNFLEDYQNFNSKEIELGTSDKISTNEMIAKVQDFFQA